MIRELLGKNKEEEEETFIYTQKGDRKEIMEIPEEFIGSWLINIYQKAKKTRERREFRNNQIPHN